MTTKPRIGHARDLARALLRKHRITRPPTPLDAIASAEGLSIRHRPWGKDYPVSGLLFRKRELIVINGDHSPQRQRFSLAHELGHYVLHHHLLLAELATVDIDHPPEGAEAHGDKVLETEADAFASELLIPLEFLLRLRPRGRASIDEPASPFNNAFAALQKQLGSNETRVSEQRLADLFDVSRTAMFVALKQHGLL